MSNEGSETCACGFERQNCHCLKWYPFEKEKGPLQKLPSASKPVLVCLDPCTTDYCALPEGIVVGYLKYAAGDKDCPEFITPGANRVDRDVIAWCDCLPAIDVYTLWKGASHAKRS